MMRPMMLLSLASVLAMVMTSPARADDRMDRMERDLQQLQKYVYRGEGGGKDGGNGSAPATATLDKDNARTHVQFSEMNERLRLLEGRLETLEFENRKLRESQERMQKDIDMRLSDLEHTGGGKLNADEAKAPATAKEDEEAAQLPTETKQLKKPSSKPADEEEDAGKKFASSREHYDDAFRLLQQTQYDDAQKSFESFIKRYPKDPLLGNAYYWAGQTYFVRQNYVQAADYFRQGFEAMPEGPKAGDNLLKLARSLAALDRKSEACVVLKQVSSKFGKNSVDLKKQSDAERTRIGCQG